MTRQARDRPDVPVEDERVVGALSALLAGGTLAFGLPDVLDAVYASTVAYFVTGTGAALLLFLGYGAGRQGVVTAAASVLFGSAFVLFSLFVFQRAGSYRHPWWMASVPAALCYFLGGVGLVWAGVLVVRR